MNSSFEKIVSIEGVGMLATLLGAIVTILTYFNINLRKDKKQFEKLNPNLKVLANYRDVWNSIVAILESERSAGNEIAIKNIGLDLEKVLPDIKEYIDANLKNDERKKFYYSAVMINPDSTQLKPLIDGSSNLKTVYVNSAKAKLDHYKETFRTNTMIVLEANQYDAAPVIHGIEINGKYLFIGFTEIKRGKIFGSECPYLYLEYDAGVLATSHFFTVYNSWFDYYKRNGKYEY